MNTANSLNNEIYILKQRVNSSNNIINQTRFKPIKKNIIMSFTMIEIIQNFFVKNMQGL